MSLSADEALDRFGEFLMHRVRDQAIADWDSIIAGKMKSDRARELHERMKVLSPDAIEAIRALIPQVVDSTLHQLLWGLEEVDDISVEVAGGDKVHDLRTV